MRLFFGALTLALVFGPSAEAKDQGRNSGKSALPVARGGIKTPGIQIPFSALQEEVAVVMPGVPIFGLIEAQNLIALVRDPGSIQRLQNRENKLLEAIKGTENPCAGAVVAFGSLWVPDCSSQSLHRYDLKTGKITQTIGVGNNASLPAIAATADSVWILSDAKGSLSRIDPDTNQVVSEVRLEAGCNGIYAEQNSLWLPCSQSNRLLKVNPRTNLVEKRIEVAAKPVSLSFGEGHLWVLGAKEGKISKVDPKTDKVVATVDTNVADADGTLAFGDGFLWLSQPGFPLTKIDAKTDKVMQQFYGNGGSLIRFAFNSVWLADPTGKRLLRFDPKRIAAALPE